jgi:tetratricopeptide (TPR) repeat protein
MFEPLRGPTATGGSPARPDAAERYARIEELLLSGLDHYFAGRYEQAIDIWTRVVFLERRHGRARAYIERARSALAERQRESEEFLHQGLEAYRHGQIESARALLTRAVEHGGPSDGALALQQRLRRLEPVAGVPAALSTARLPGHAATPTAPVAGRLATICACLVAVAAVVGIASPLISFLAELPVAGAAATPPLVPQSLPYAEPSEGLVRQARALYRAGRSKEGLRLLEAVPLGDPLRPEADRLRAEIARSVIGAVLVTPVEAEGVPRASAAGTGR